MVAVDTDEITQTNAVGSSTSTRVPSWTVTNLRSSKAADPDLKKILAWKQNQTSQPAFREIERTSKATRSLWARWNRLQLENGVLYRRWKTDDGHGTRLQLVLPRSMVSKVLSVLHDAPSAGHLGVNRDLKILDAAALKNAVTSERALVVTATFSREKQTLRFALCERWPKRVTTNRFSQRSSRFRYYDFV